MTLVIRVAGANWAGKGFPNLYPFIAPDDLEFGFDFRARADMLTDFAGKHTVTPKKVDIAAGTLNVTDASIMVSVDDGLGVRVDLGYLQCSLAAIPIPSGGSRQFTIMLVSRGGGVAFPADKVVVAAPTRASLFDWGSYVSPSGFSVDRSTAQGLNFGRINNASTNLSPETDFRAITTPDVLFLTYDGTNWTLLNKTLGLSATRTNAANPLPVNTNGWSDGKVSLAGSVQRTSTTHAYSPVVYQRAMWNRVLTGAEITEQYLRTKTGRAALAL
jgi:hypothetical protein